MTDQTDREARLAALAARRSQVRPTTSTSVAMTDQTDREARLAALAARRPPVRQTPSGDPWEEAGAAPASSQPPTSVRIPTAGVRSRRRAPALASRVLVAGLSVAAMLGLVAFIGAGAMASATVVEDPAPPTAVVVHRIVVVASPPPPQPDVKLAVVPASHGASTVVTLPVATTTTTIAVRPKPTASSTSTATKPVTTTKASGKP